ncbi:MAG TPA: glycosyltransferase [Chloroflexota bacterium]|nr:glycosyltransferase [Chloroflexota bacterium]
MPRVAMISEHASPAARLGSTDAGGQNTYVDQVSRGVARLGYEVDVFTRADDPAELAIRTWGDGIRIVPVVAGPLRPIPKDSLWPHLGDFLASTERLAADSGPYDLIHANFWMSGWVGARLKRRWNVPFVETFHALGAVKRLHQGQADTSPPERPAAERAVLEAADCIIAQCPREVDELVAMYAADASRARIIPSGVDVERFFPIDQASARRELGLPLDERLVVYVGRLLPRKDVENVIRAIALLPSPSPASVRLLVVGGETEEAALDREPEMRRLLDVAAALGVRDRVTFVGRRPADRLRTYYSAADVFVSTPWYEPFGLTPLEAMACGTPAVCSAVGGITFTVADGVTGFLVPPREPGRLAERLARVLADEDLRRRLAQNARRRVEELFTWSTVATKTADVYQELLAGGAACHHHVRRNH